MTHICVGQTWTYLGCSADHYIWETVMPLFFAVFIFSVFSGHTSSLKNYKLSLECYNMHKNACYWHIICGHVSTCTNKDKQRQVLYFMGDMSLYCICEQWQVLVTIFNVTAGLLLYGCNMHLSNFHLFWSTISWYQCAVY